MLFVLSLITVYSMCCALSFGFYLNWQCSCYTYNFIYLFLSFKLDINLILWWQETYGAVKPRVIKIIPALVVPLIPCYGGLTVYQPFFHRMVVSPIGITFVLAILVCTYLTPMHFLLMLFFLYVRTLCSPLHKPLFSYNFFFFLSL